MSLGGSNVLEVFLLNKNSNEDDLQQCIQWLKEVFHDPSPKNISVIVKRLGGNDPQNTTHISKSNLKDQRGLNSTVNTSMMNNTILGNQNNSSFDRNNNNNYSNNGQQKKETKQDNLQNRNEQSMQQGGLNNEMQTSERKTNQNERQQPSHQNSNQGRPQSPKSDHQSQSNAHLAQENAQKVSNNSQISNASIVYDENDPQSVSDKARQQYINKQFDQATQSYLESNKLANRNKKQYAKLIFQNNVYLGSIFANSKEKEKHKSAIEFLESAYQMKDSFNIKEIIEPSEQNSGEGTQKYICTNPLYFINLTLGNLYNEQKNLDKALTNFENAYQEIEKLQTTQDNKNQALVLNSLGMIYYAKAEIPTAIEKFKSSLKIFEDLMKQPEHENDLQLKSSYANRLNNLGEAFRRNKQIDEAIDYFQKSLDLKKEIQTKNNDKSAETEKSIASTLNNLGMTFFSKKEYEQAIENLNQAIKKYEDILSVYLNTSNVSNNSVNQHNELLDLLAYANILNQRGDCYRARQELQKACDDYKKAYKTKLDCIGEKNKSTLLSLNNYAQLLFTTKNYAKSKQAFTDLLRMQREFNDMDLQIGQTLNNLGTVLSENQEYEQAEEKIKEAISIFEKTNMSQQNLEKVKKNLDAIIQKKQKRNL